MPKRNSTGDGANVNNAKIIPMGTIKGKNDGFELHPIDPESQMKSGEIALDIMIKAMPDKVYAVSSSITHSTAFTKGRSSPIVSTTSKYP